MKKTILVTGGSGFIGSNFIRFILNGRHRYFRGKDIRLINLDKLTYSGNPYNLKDIAKDARYDFVKGDITDRSLVDKLVKKCSIIINFAAESHVDRSIRDPFIFVKTNILGTQVLLDSARLHKTKLFVHISTDEVYGSIEKGYTDESSNLRPNSPYAASKTGADLLARSYFITYKMPVIITRSSNNFGPYQYPEKMIPLFITNAVDDQPLPVYADGSNVRDWIYVEDNCDAIGYVVKNGAPGEVYNIGGGNELKNLELTKKILKILGKTEKLIKFVKDRPGHDKRYALDSYKLYKLGWRPSAGGFDDKLRKTVQWYEENRAWWEKLKKKKEKFW